MMAKILVGIQLVMLGVGVLTMLFGDILIAEVDRQDEKRGGGGR